MFIKEKEETKKNKTKQEKKASYFLQISPTIDKSKTEPISLFTCITDTKAGLFFNNASNAR